MKYKIGCSEYPETIIEFDGLEPKDLINILKQMYYTHVCIKNYTEKQTNAMIKELSLIFKDKFENYFWAMAPISKSLAKKEAINYYTKISGCENLPGLKINVSHPSID